MNLMSKCLKYFEEDRLPFDVLETGAADYELWSDAGKCRDRTTTNPLQILGDGFLDNQVARMPRNSRKTTANKKAFSSNEPTLSRGHSFL